MADKDDIITSLLAGGLITLVGYGIYKVLKCNPQKS